MYYNVLLWIFYRQCTQQIDSHSTYNLPSNRILYNATTSTNAHHSKALNSLESGSSGINLSTHHSNLSSTGAQSSSSSISVSAIGNTNNEGMSHWINDTATAVKSEIRSPGLGESASLSTAGGITSAHLDTAALFCANASPLDPLQSSGSYDHKQDYYNYYGSMQQYTPSFYSSYTPYQSRSSTKLPSPNAYLTSGAYAAATNNNSAQIYSGYAGYQSFSQFSSHAAAAAQQDYSGYYNDYSNYYATAPGYSPYVGSPSSSGSQSFHTSAGLSGEFFIEHLVNFDKYSKEKILYLQKVHQICITPQQLLLY